MDSIQSIFGKRKVIIEKLQPFGFRHEGSEYIYSRKLPGSGFEMTVTVKDNGPINATVVDTAFNEPYTLHLVDSAEGGFVGGVRTEYKKLLTEISEQCFEADIFKSAQTKELIEYVRMHYGDEPEFLWEKFTDNAVLRRKDTKKWYAALLTVSKRKLGIPLDETAEIIDMRIAPENMAALIDGKTYFPGWHMNKKSWYTIILDGSVPLDELKQRLDESYNLATK